MPPIIFLNHSDELIDQRNYLIVYMMIGYILIFSMIKYYTNLYI